MAVYKPSNCRPFLNAIDLTKSQTIQCEINTSNTKITGYKLKILDNSNEVLFEGKDYDLVQRTMGRQGVISTPLGVTNGSILSVDFLLVDATLDNSMWPLVGWNTIYCVKQQDIGTDNWTYTYYYRTAVGDVFDPGVNADKVTSKFSNDYLNQPFKWQLTVAQGQNSAGQVQDYSFDVLVTTGTILGSNATRIQSNLSEEIYKDYYIQLTGPNNYTSERVRISSYDRTFGYIYPQEGFLTDDDIKKATEFSIYKDTADAQYVSAARTVDFAVAQQIETAQWWSAFGFTEKPSPEEFSIGEFGPSANKYYFQMQVKGITKEQYQAFNSSGIDINTLFPGSSNQGIQIVFNSTRFLFMQQAGTPYGSDFNSTYSAYNGVWVLVGAVSETLNGETKYYIRWQRPSGANSWANYLGRNWFVANQIVGNNLASDNVFTGQQNISSNAQAGTSGTLNSTTLAFFPEEKITIYPNGEDAKGVTGLTPDTGVIFKNSDTRIYLRPFVGLANGMRIRWSDALGVTQYFDISNLDTNYYYCTPINNSTVELPDIDTNYKIYSYFKTSDENPFYGYTQPTLAMTISPETTLTTTYPFVGELNSRSLNAYGVYTQAQHISWKNFQWKLADISVNAVVDSGVIYNGDIYYHFDGLQDDHRYQLTLIVEDEVGYVQEAFREFKVTLKGLKSGEEFPLTVSFDCATQSIDINFMRNGIIIPYYWDEGQADNDYGNPGFVYTDGSVSIPDDLTLFYNKVQASNPTGEDETIIASLSGPETNSLTLNCEHTNISRYFTGELFEAEIILDSTKQDTRVRIGGMLPITTTFDQNGELIPNPDRNKILLNYWTETATLNLLTNEIEWKYSEGSLVSYPMVIVGGEADNGNLGYWRNSLPIVYAYQNPKDVESGLLGDFDYLPIAYFNPEDEDQYKETTKYARAVGAADKIGLQVQNGQDNYRYYYFSPDEYNCSIILHFPLSQHTEFYVVKPDEANYDVLAATSTVEQKQYEDYLVREKAEAGQYEYTTVWQDAKGFLATQINGYMCNVKAKEMVLTPEGTIDNTAPIAPIFVMHRWSDNTVNNLGQSIRNLWTDLCATGAPVWKGVNVNTYIRNGVVDNRDGRQYIADIDALTFNVGVKNFDTTEVNFANILELSGICYINGGK